MQKPARVPTYDYVTPGESLYQHVRNTETLQERAKSNVDQSVDKSVLDKHNLALRMKRSQAHLAPKT